MTTTPPVCCTLSNHGPRSSPLYAPLSASSRTTWIGGDKLAVFCCCWQRAFNAEVASIKDTVRTNPATGKIRMQWWRERIYDMYTPKNERPPPDTMLLRVLGEAIEQHALTRRWFERLIDARVGLHPHFTTWSTGN
jgi:hypothetical protein